MVIEGKKPRVWTGVGGGEPVRVCPVSAGADIDDDEEGDYTFGYSENEISRNYNSMQSDLSFY